MRSPKKMNAFFLYRRAESIKVAEEFPGITTNGKVCKLSTSPKQYFVKYYLLAPSFISQNLRRTLKELSPEGKEPWYDKSGQFAEDWANTHPVKVEKKPKPKVALQKNEKGNWASLMASALFARGYT
jgi:hypothetical protein